MEKVGLEEKTRFRNELKNIIYKNPGIDAVTKQVIDSELEKKLFGVSVTKDDLERIKKETLDLLDKKVSKIVDKVSDNLAQPKKSNISGVQDINTLTKDNGAVITSVKTNDGSIYVKDSSYSGNIRDVVGEVAKQNPNMTSQEMENKAFNTIQQRQIDIPMVSINTLDEKTRESVSKLPGDNKKINNEYQILVDERNRLMDLKNIQNNSNQFSMDDGQNISESNYMTPKSNSMAPKSKQLVKSIAGIKFNDAAFVDAMLLGGITLYTGVLGLCALLTKM